MEDPVGEIKHLKECVNNLISVLALPAVWTGGEAHQIVTALLDTLLGMLRLDCVYVGLKGTASTAPIEMIRTTASGNSAGQLGIIKDALQASTKCEAQTWPLVIQKPAGQGALSIAVFGLGLNDETGVLVAGSRRFDFPDANERLLLNAAVNQATIGLQEARILGEQRRLAVELDQKVTQRTQELDRFFTISLDLLCIADRHGYFLRLNQPWENTLGYALSELLARPFMDFVHPEDVTNTRAAYADVIAGRDVVNFINRYRGKDGTYRWLEWSAASDDQMIYATARDITERIRAEARLRQSETELQQVIDAIPALVVSAHPDGSVDFINQGWRDYTGRSLDDLQGSGWNSVIHPDDLEKFVKEWAVARTARKPFENEARVRRADGVYRWFLIRKVPLHDESGTIVKWYGTGHDVEDRKRAEDHLRLVVDTTPAMIHSARPDGWLDYFNQRWLEFLGVGLEDVCGWRWTTSVHPDDVDGILAKWRESLATGEPFEAETRVRRWDGEYRRLLHRKVPLHDENGKIVKWYGSSIDVEDRRRAEDDLRKAFCEIKKLEEQLYKENLALKEEIDRSSMFEEIVGASPALQKALSRVSKVAPTDATVLITGETGTGKELIARAVHKRSMRSERTFVSVNCAAIPPTLLSSELFGHEKGAFTGALQRRLGRFELAEGGTIFLDEIGDLPAETQIALLRILQEREFERVGGSQTVRANVRVIAATNRDLQVAIAAGTFRSDLFYRLNVFPISVPPLRERIEDIAMLVEYFVDRYANKAGKKIRGINRESLDRLISYPWPGNIRELQNVIERSVILCETENFSVDESWLSWEAIPAPQVMQPLSRKLVSQEKELIEAALAESKGRVSGTSGAAAKLGIPPSTLESRIRSLKIHKHRFA